MGLYVEYMIELSPLPAHAWLATLDGRWCLPEDPLGPGGSFEWGGRTLHADIRPAACHVTVASIKYSWLLGEGHAPSVDWVSRFELYLGEALPGVRVVRLDEYMFEHWERWLGRPWEDIPDPIGSLRDWLPTVEEGEEYYRLMPDHPSSGNT